MVPAMEVPLIQLRAPAKLNLHLGIYPGRDARGYHRADSVMIAVELADVVSLHEAPALTLTMSEDCGVPVERNTAFKAARKLCAAFGKSEGYHIHLEKHIPAQSGMGGASSDAASVILGLCRLWALDPRDERVVGVARSIGADVPFFLTLAPAYLAGAGDELVESFPALPEQPVVLVRPAVGVSTVEAYREFDRTAAEPQRVEPMCAALRASEPREVAKLLYNNLEPAAWSLAPVTREVHEWMAAQPGVWAAQLTGSGSCVFGFCESDAVARQVAQDAHKTRNWWSCATKTVGAGAQFC